MPLFICEKCGCIENTALGLYWSRSISHFEDSSLNGKALCSACAPQYYKDGSKTRWGKWHGRFPQKFEADCTKEELREMGIINKTIE